MVFITEITILKPHYLHKLVSLCLHYLQIHVGQNVFVAAFFLLLSSYPSLLEKFISIRKLVYLFIKNVFLEGGLS